MRNPFRLPPEQDRFAPELERAVVDELYRRAWTAFAALLLVLAVLRSLLDRAIRSDPAIGWVLLGMIAVTVLRTLAVVVLRHHPSSRVRHRVFLAGSLLISLGFAQLNLTSYPHLDPAEAALLGLVDAGICSGAILSMGSSFSTYLLYSVPIMGSLAVMVALAPQSPWSRNFLLLVCIYLPSLVVLAFQMAMTYRREVLLRLQMAEMAVRDNLTQLRNRHALIDFMSSEAEQVLRSWRATMDPAHPKVATSLGILMVDMDNFKAVNDTHGHAAGDAVLKQLADLLVETARKPDLVVRWGGEEFVVVARDTDRLPPSRLAERIRERVADHVFRLPSGHTLRGTCSIGYSVFPFDGKLPGLLSWEQVLSAADAGMYFAKTHGRNRCTGIVAGDRIQEGAEVLAHIEEDLKGAEAAGLVIVVP